MSLHQYPPFSICIIFYYQLHNRHSRVEIVQKTVTWWRLLYRFPLLLAFDVIMQAEIVQKMVTWWQFLYIQHIRPTILQTVVFTILKISFTTYSYLETIIPSMADDITEYTSYITSAHLRIHSQRDIEYLPCPPA